MVVINACIYNCTNLGAYETEKLNRGLQLLKIERFVNVFTIPKLIEELDANPDREILLISNFPPKELYLKNNVSQSIIDKYENIVPVWNLPEYKISAGLFTHICKCYKFMAIHWITGAPQSYVTDSHILTITGNIPTTIKRKHDWTVEGANFEVMLRVYMLNMITETVKR